MSKQFKENLDTAVFTSNYIMKENYPVVYVVHHEDGTWDFWGEQIIDESEIIVVSLRQILDIDPTILELNDLPVAFTAMRKSREDPWMVASKN
ncbi:hypothetical protein DU508_23670 [Pedobacter chinensis]|uniref:DUF2185 domain-containing protein n=1 Tax=Pedobacter chinensis TaxID=2282421 RepID=A0A369PN86_9SPHI|nr:hypothetical protein [Pedobacter chinensis]RDC54053.1 hypothetical protein DU508_23670 [Pedobacter chinensis]